ncbi:MAG: hypothetical protein EZS28_030618 [Streblomastix strix]|uniref:Uncharacterized protein n=1 Tax=Streblomastix strix TaxID=222440 RepID=A0A5J4UVS0_9EUKA|nr:MAG: hypothetical protein EZS28_030618 [Streblomastix strix]
MPILIPALLMNVNLDEEQEKGGIKKSDTSTLIQSSSQSSQRNDCHWNTNVKMQTFLLISNLIQLDSSLFDKYGDNSKDVKGGKKQKYFTLKMWERVNQQAQRNMQKFEQDIENDNDDEEGEEEEDEQPNAKKLLYDQYDIYPNDRDISKEDDSNEDDGRDKQKQQQQYPLNELSPLKSVTPHNSVMNDPSPIQFDPYYQSSNQLSYYSQSSNVLSPRSTLQSPKPTSPSPSVIYTSNSPKPTSTHTQQIIFKLKTDAKQERLANSK